MLVLTYRFVFSLCFFFFKNIIKGQYWGKKKSTLPASSHFQLRNLLSPILFPSAKELGDFFFYVYVHLSLTTCELVTPRTSCGKELHSLTKYCMKKIRSHVCSWICHLLAPFDPQVLCWKRQAVAGPYSASPCHLWFYRYLLLSCIIFSRWESPGLCSHSLYEGIGSSDHWPSLLSLLELFPVSVNLVEKDQNCKNYPSSGQNMDLDSNIVMFSVCFSKNAGWFLGFDDCALSWWCVC